MSSGPEKDYIETHRGCYITVLLFGVAMIVGVFVIAWSLCYA